MLYSRSFVFESENLIVFYFYTRFYLNYLS